MVGLSILVQSVMLLIGTLSVLSGIMGGEGGLCLFSLVVVFVGRFLCLVLLIGLLL